MGTLDGRVAIVTGAGRGIGREHALLMAGEGAMVVVNDLGGANDGSGSDTTPAEEVVAEISAAGGQATVSTGDVSSWDGSKELIEQAVGEFGGLDILVNNAGILRDAFIPAMTEEQWDSVIAVHLKGHAATLHHAAAYWKDRSKRGEEIKASVVNTASASGTFMTNAGRANYGAAAAGIAAMTRVAAAGLERYGGRVNAIAPVARTRLTLATPGMGAIFAAEVPEGAHDGFAPANIAPIVAYLAQESCPLTGQVFAVQGGAVQSLSGWAVTGTIQTDGLWTVDDLAQRLPSIT